MDLTNDNFIRAFWLSSNNVGDNLNWYIIRKLSNKYVSYSHRDKPHYIVCGSILSEANEKSTVWGAGFNWEHHKEQDLNGCKDVVAVRGELSAQRCNREIKAVGDPALLMPQLFNGMKMLKHAIGIIPHWTNVERTVTMFPDRFIINPLSTLEQFINGILSCEYIFSESLHGLILADAYGVPNSWINLGGDTGDGFKYKDYYSTTISPDITPITALDIHSCQVHKYKHNIDLFLKSCPFYFNKK